MKKIKKFLNQLLDSQKNAIEQTITFQTKHRRKNWKKFKIENKDFWVHPYVFHAGVFPSSAWFAKLLKEIIKEDRRFCEIGCGSGVISCLLASSLPKVHVVASDINPFAYQNTQKNVKLHNLKNQIDINIGDVFDGVPQGNSFDSVFWALPFVYLPSDTIVNFEEIQVFDPGYQAISKFFKDAKQFLNPNGRLLIGFSPDLGNSKLLYELAKKFNLSLKVIAETQIKEKDTAVFQILQGYYA